MAILHGGWLLSTSGESGRGEHSSLPAAEHLFLWGETWRRLTPDSIAAEANGDQNPAVLPHPLAMTIAELADFLRSLHQSSHLRLPNHLLESLLAESRVAPGKRRTSQAVLEERQVLLSVPIHTLTLALPSYAVEENSPIVLPQHSAAALPEQNIGLYPWRVSGICLSVGEAIALLNSLPLGTVSTADSFVGADLRFWSHIVRWSLDLLARSKFLPGLEKVENGTTYSPYYAQWQPLLDSSMDQARLSHFLAQIPPVCQMYQQGAIASEPLPFAVDLPTDPHSLLQNFLSRVIDNQLRQAAKQHPLPEVSERSARNAGSAIESPLREWLQALGSNAGSLAVPGLDSLQTLLTTWTAPLQQRGFEQNLYRTCLYLHPPRSGETHWTLEYFLQAADNPEFLVSAPTIWGNPVERLRFQGRSIPNPQETFLMGLGLASRLYPLLEPSLQQARPQFCTLDPLQAYDFLRSIAWRLQDNGLGVVVPPSLANEGGWASRLGLKIQAQTGKPKKGERLGLQSLLNFRWELSIGGQTLTKEEFGRLVALKTPLVEINGEWVELRPQDIRAAESFFASRKDQTALSLEDALRISTGDTRMIEKLPVVSFEASGNLQELINTISGKRTIEPIAEPEGFQGELRPYQSRGVGWLAFLEQWGLGACLADDMGLGKTIQLIAFLLHLKQQNRLETPILLVCPTSVLGNWEREVKKFGPRLKVLQHHGDGRPKGKGFARAVQGKDLVITSYALIHRDLNDLKSVEWQGVVLDEAQNIKNSDAKQSQAARQVEAQFRIALTGTPVENRLTELWSIMDFLNPAYLGPKNFFQRRFATPIERYGDVDSLKTLRSLVQPFILRRLKTDRDIIQDLPEKQEMNVFCGLTSEQAAIYQNIVEKSLADIESADGIQRKGIILALLVKLKQICNHPDLFLKDTDAAEVAQLKNQAHFESRSGKLLRLDEMLEELLEEGDRALIFTQFAEWGKLLKSHLERQMGREVLFLYGSTPKKQREEMVDRFQHDPQGPRLFILSLKAGGVGLNLTRANHVFHFDRWWNPAVENQATDRVFRIGQTRNVQVHKFVCNGTLEEKIHDLIESKKALAENVVGAGENWLTELDTDSLRNLLLLDRSAIIGEE